VSLGFDEKAREWSDELRELHIAAEQRDVTEALCLLYVAMTRAIRRLEMVVLPEGVQRSEATRFSAVVRGALLCGVPADDGAIWRAPLGEDDWAAGLGSPDDMPPAPAAPMPVLRVGAEARATAVRTPSGEVGEATDVADVLGRRRGAAVHGTLIHRLFEAVEWLDDRGSTDGELFACLADAGATDAERTAAVVGFRAALAQPQIGELLRRPAHDVTVHRERSFAVLLPVREGGEELWSGSFDRLVLTREADRVVAADVIDFKTDAIRSDAALHARVERYRPQLEAYRRVAATMFGLDPERVRALLAFVTPGAVIAL
jgi:ATP-dependent exoDNAse (exonuclease V) beta subunit